MKLPNKRTFFIIIPLSTIILLTCNNKEATLKTTISVASLQKGTLDSGKALTLLQILKTYPAQEECNAKEKYANLYICRKFTNGDTIYVFEECSKVDPIALDSNSHYAGVIDKNNMFAGGPDKFTVFVTPNFRIPDQAKYFFARLNYQTEY